MKYFITHVFNEGLPSNGLRKIAYITMTDEDNDEYFLGIDNNPLEAEQINRMLATKKIFAITQDFPELKEGKSLFVDKDGFLYFADRLNADLGREKLHVHIREFKDMNVQLKADRYIPKKLPFVNKYHEYAS